MPPERLDGWPVDWPAPPGVRAFMSTRRGGVSQGRYASLNLGRHVGDDPSAVEENRRRLAQVLGTEPRWLNQVHGAGVVSAAELQVSPGATADAVWSTAPGQACAVLVADCLPVLLASRGAPGVAAVHAGWRGLAAGVVDAAVRALCTSTGSHPRELVAWLGPCIGPRQFEVGDDVQQAFGADGAARFQPHRRRDGSAAWLCDLPGLAADRLQRLGLCSVSLGTPCTVEEASTFFSYRRDGITGRMAACIMLEA